MTEVWQRARDAVLERLSRWRPAPLDARAHSLGLQHRLNLLGRRFDALSVRERAALALASIAIVLVLWDRLLMRPLYARERIASGALSQLAPAADDAPAAAGAAPPGAIEAAAARERALARQSAERDRRIRERAAQLVEPSQMRALLENLIAVRDGLRIVRLANLPVEEIRAARDPLARTDVADTRASEPADLATGAEPPVAYVHGIEIVVEGSFAEIHDYIAAIEAQGWRFLWRRVEVDAARWPLVRGQFTLATLSLERSWLSL